MKLQERDKAGQLRHQGLSIKQISEALNVSKGSVSVWVRDIELSEGALRNIKNRYHLGRERSRNTRLINIANSNVELNLKCKKEILLFTKRDLWIAGLLIYAGEGSKPLRTSYQRVEVTNADANILRIFIKFLLEICLVPSNKIIARIILYDDINVQEALHYWSSQLNIPLCQFQKSFIKQSYRSVEYRHLRRSKYGTVHVIVHNVVVYRKIMAWLAAIYEYNNLDFK